MDLPNAMPTPPTVEGANCGLDGRTMRILVGLIEHMGDIAACEPVARYLKINNPSATLAWAVHPRYRELVDVNPYIDETVPVDCLTDWMKLSAHGAFDQIVDLHVNYRVCQHCQIPLTKRTGNPFVTSFDWFDHGALLEAFSLGAGLPRLSAQPRLYLASEHVDAVTAIGLPPDFCVIHRQSNETAKDWNEDGWRALCTMIRQRLGLAIVEVGAGKSSALPPPLDGVISLVNRLPILQTAEVIRRARVFIGIDSGPGHFANALEVPGVVLLGTHGFFREYSPYTGFYASTSPLVKLVRNRVGRACDLTIDEVADAVRYVVAASVEVTRRAPMPSPEARSMVAWDAPREPRAADVAASGLFDVGWYAIRYPEVMAGGRHPIDHFLQEGAGKFYHPGPDFDSDAYGAADPEVARQGLVPLLHYIDNGRAEGRQLRSRERGPDGEPRKHRALGSTDRPPGISEFLGITDNPQGAPTREMPRTFAFYLPQFHPIPENDWAHGPGFSEWHNVIKATPLFPGHHQPRVPGELGFYDLRSEEVLQEQIRLALEHGITGFCFYYYYFQGRKLLYRPLENFIKSDTDMPFMCLWANENWTKRWDGANKDVIVAQNHSDEDDLLALRELIPLFLDRRYVKIGGKPMLMVYKTFLFPNISHTVDLWREEIVRHGFPGLFLVMVDDWTPNPHHPREIGFDASYEIPSNIVPAEVMREDISDLGLAENFVGRIVDYPKFAGYHLGRPFPTYKRFRTVMLPWDNTPRYGPSAMVQLDGEDESYKLWLLQALLDTQREHLPGERIVFLHSWNEWCEGTYLEPDRNNGRFFLEQTREAIAIAREAIGAAGELPTEQVAAELLKLQRAKDAGAFQVVASTRMQVHYAWRDLLAEREEAARRREEIKHLRHRLEQVAHDSARARALDIAAIETMRRSKSWRLTAPLRAILWRLRRR